MKQSNEQTIYDMLILVHEMAAKVVNSPSEYLEMEDELYNAQNSLTTAWVAIRSLQRLGKVDKVNNEAMTAKLKIAGL